MTSIGTGTQNVIVFGRSLLYGRTLRLENFNKQFLARLICLSCQDLKAIGGRVLLKSGDNYHVLNFAGVLGVTGKDLDNRMLSSSENQLITALCATGALCGVVAAEAAADKYGLPPAIWFALVLFTLGAIIQAISYTVAQISVGQFLIGLGVAHVDYVTDQLPFDCTMGTARLEVWC